ncbi:J domain-containing protein [Providencia sp. Me31A]|uniref:J domain-containing protein n=1 Tax=Providencia sp. Me31A TaxID=3392637 RepID=UPI003D2B66FC
MDIWQILEISATDDEKEIRRAYAKQLKKYRPDTHPKEYQQLREAFEKAKEIVSNQEHYYAEFVFKDENHSEAAPLDEHTGYQEVSFSHWLTNQSIAEESLTTTSVVEAVYTQDEINTVASLIVENERKGKTALSLLWSHVLEYGNLQLFSQFNKDFAKALSQQQGLMESTVECVSELLDWRLNEYNSDSRIPVFIQEGLQKQLRNTEVARAWRDCEIEASHPHSISAFTMRFLISESTDIKWWMRLVPGLLDLLMKQYKQITHNYPELTDRINPSVAAFFSQPRTYFEVYQLFLLVFWGSQFCLLSHSENIDNRALVTVAVIFVFYLFLSDALLFFFVNKNKDTAGAIFLLLDFLFSIMVLIGIYAFIMSVIVDIVNIKIKGGDNQVGTIMFSGMFLLIIIWQIAPKTKGIPKLRLPGITVSRILAFPWIFIKWFNSWWIALTWGLLIYIILELTLFGALLKISEVINHGLW